MKWLISFIFIISSFNFCYSDLLYWMVDSDAEVVNTGEYVYLFLMDHDEIVWDGSTHIIVARVNVYDGNGNLLKTMENITGPIGGGNSWDTYIDIGHPGSGKTPEIGATATSTQWNNLGRPYYYQVEILAGEKHGGAYIYEEVMWSAMFSGALLEHQGSYDLTYDPHLENMVPWIPTEFYTSNPVPKYDWPLIPEPTAGILELVGICMLLLKRKKIC